MPMTLPLRMNRNMFSGARVEARSTTPRKVRANRSLLAIGFLFLSLTTLMPPAASATASSDDQPISLSLKPINQTGSYFAVTIEPGQSLELDVELGNYGTGTIAARTYSADAYSIINGGFGAKNRDSIPTGATSWMDYPAGVVQLPAGEASTRPFTVNVPTGTAPGYYLSSLILENDIPIQGSGSVALNQIVRQALPVSIQVPGPLKPAFELGQADHTVSAGNSVVGISIANTGNTNLKPAGSLTVQGLDGEIVSQAPITLGAIYAHSATQVETILDGTLQPGKYTINISLTDAGTDTTATGADVPFAVDKPSESTNTSILPDQLPQILQDATTGTTGPIIGAGLLSLLAVLAVLLLVRRRKRNVRVRLSDGETTPTTGSARTLHKTMDDGF